MRIDNIVASGSFNQVLNLEALDRDIPQVQYDAEMYHGAYLKKDRHSITIYRSGKYIMPGMKSFEDVSATYDDMVELLAPYLDTSLFSRPTIRNMVCSSDCGRKLDLTRILVELQSRGCEVNYDPEMFPGLIYKTEVCTYNVFQSGRFIILGCTTLDDVYRSEREFLSFVSDDV